MSKIRVWYESIDGVNKVTNFETIEAARGYAEMRIGKYPTLGRTYAVSDDGVGKITVRGCTLKELFPEGF